MAGRKITQLMLIILVISGCSSHPNPGPIPSAPATQAPFGSTTIAAQASLDGLSLDDFYNASMRALNLRHPETVLVEGLTEAYGVSEVSLDDISGPYQQETNQLTTQILDKLHSYDRAALNPGQAISYDIYEWYLQDLLACQEFSDHDYPATYHPNASIPEQMIQFFTVLHPLTNEQEARDYIARLNLVPQKMDQLLEGLEQREDSGITPPGFAVQWELYGTLQGLISSPSKDTPFYTVFEEKVNALQDISPEEKQSLLADAEEAISERVLPAYRELANYLEDMPVYSGEDSGIWRLPDGEQYYAMLLRHYTTTDLTAEEINDIGIQELERIHTAMRGIFDQLGYPQDEDLVQLFDRVGRDGGHVAGNDVLTTYEHLVRDAEQNLEPAFDIRPRAQVVVIGDQVGGFYITGSRDGSRPGEFFAGVNGTGEQSYAMPTLAYHEAIPGHHFQMSITQELQGVPDFRTANLFLANIEGWALYAERLAWELGWYENDPYGELGFLQAQAFRAARLVVDTGLHARGWSFDEAQQFFTDNTGYAQGDTIDPKYQIARYLVLPGQATSYYIGYMKIMELRQRAMDQLGDQFNLVEFHHVILSSGGMPLELLERLVDAYIQENLSQ